MSSVFVTGLEGFTGMHLLRTLRERGHDVTGLTRSEPARNLPAVACDLLDRERLGTLVREARPDAVIHLAGVSRASGNPERTYETNILGTRNLLEALAGLTRAPVVLLPSSGTVYGNASVDPIDEDVPPRPGSDYAVSKLAMEHMARLWSEALPLVMVRPFNYTGVGQTPAFVIPKIVEHAREGAEVISLGNVDVERDFSDVRCVCEAYAKLIEARPVGATLNVCSGSAYSLREVVETVGEIAGRRIEIRSDPTLVRTNEAPRLRGDPTRLRETLGEWSPRSLRETLEWMYGA